MMAVNNQRVEEQSPFGNLTVIGEDIGSADSEAPSGSLTVVGDDVGATESEAPFGTLAVVGDDDESSTEPVSEDQRMQELDEALAREDSLTATESSQDDLQGRLVKKLRDREGVKQEAYLDSLGKPTGGVGHLLVGDEVAKYPVGSEIPQEVVDDWLVSDSEKALEAAKKQALEVGVEDQDFLVALASVNFQLGNNWKGEHEQTWRLMKEGKFKEAAEEAANSEWSDQTPKRVKDFQEALYKEAEKRI